MLKLKCQHTRCHNHEYCQIPAEHRAIGVIPGIITPPKDKTLTEVLGIPDDNSAESYCWTLDLYRKTTSESERRRLWNLLGNSNERVRQYSLLGKGYKMVYLAAPNTRDMVINHSKTQV